MQPFAFTNERIEELEVLLQSHLKLLTEEHVSLSQGSFALSHRGSV